MGRAFLYFDSHISVKLKVFGEPNSRKMAPPKLLYNDISIVEHFPHMHGVVPPYFLNK